METRELYTLTQAVQSLTVAGMHYSNALDAIGAFLGSADLGDNMHKLYRFTYRDTYTAGFTNRTMNDIRRSLNMEPELMPYYFTFGGQYDGTNHPTYPKAHRDGYVIVNAQDQIEAREYFIKRIKGNAWATTYNVAQWFGVHGISKRGIGDMYPLGVLDEWTVIIEDDLDPSDGSVRECSMCEEACAPEPVVSTLRVLPALAGGFVAGYLNAHHVWKGCQHRPHSDRASALECAERRLALDPHTSLENTD